ncbi:unnamed protein product [Brachionus calyciflorus]|uniref:triacylglycerol lipase n=1 Tax=Brachionus calyciflorus TaxID=104777 RepID=A0A813M7Z1_9BILA|nr:unnamed protein product [Brachionus calyciflorus]
MLNLSLSGCGFLGIYHIGVISAFKEHAPEIIQNNKISGCSAGSLVAACAVSDCCLGQMVSAVLEIALKARSHALGPLHPSFNIVDILRNGLRRILPVDAHKLCSDKVHISLTRWKDGKNFLVNQFDSREELIQALICSSFVPFYSGFIPPKFKGTYFWDGGLSNNNPILDQNTILVSPFGGEADICPRGESASWACLDFQGTNVQWSHENMYRISKALFPPDPQILKAICFRGYKDAIGFLKSRNLLQCSCFRIRDRTSISSVIGEDLHAYSIFDEEEVSEENSSSLYDSDEDNILQYAQTNQPINYGEMPTSVSQILDAACDDDKGLINLIYNSQLSRAISIFFLPWTLPVEFSVKFSKKALEMIPQIKVSPDSKGVVDSILLLINYLIHRFTYDRYQYHSRVSCKLCNFGRNAGSSLTSGIPYSVCHHGSAIESLTKISNVDSTSDASRLSVNMYPKICPRHRVPSICSSETASMSSYRYRKPKRNRSYISSDVASSVDLNEYKSSRSYTRRKKYNSLNEDSTASLKKLSQKSKKSNRSLDKLTNSDEKLDKHEFKPKTKVHFHLNDESESDTENKDHIKSNENVNLVTEDNGKVQETSSMNKIIRNYSKNGKIQKIVSLDEDTNNNNNDICPPGQLRPEHNNGFKYTDNLEWESYWDNLELNAIGRVNLDI